AHGPRPARPRLIRSRRFSRPALFDQGRGAVVEGRDDLLAPLDFPWMEIAEPRTRVGTVRQRTSRISQAVTFVAVLMPPLGIFSAMGLLWGVPFHWEVHVMLADSFTVCAYGPTSDVHRVFY